MRLYIVQLSNVDGSLKMDTYKERLFYLCWAIFFFIMAGLMAIYCLIAAHHKEWRMLIFDTILFTIMVDTFINASDKAKKR